MHACTWHMHTCTYLCRRARMCARTCGCPCVRARTQGCALMCVGRRAGVGQVCVRVGRAVRVRAMHRLRGKMTVFDHLNGRPEGLGAFFICVLFYYWLFERTARRLWRLAHARAHAQMCTYTHTYRAHTRTNTPCALAQTRASRHTQANRRTDT